MTVNLSPALRVLGICAIIGAATTAINTLLPNFYEATDFASAAALIHNPYYALRQWVLLVHPAFTLMFSLGLALALFTRAPGRASAAFVFAGVEKITEFVLGTLIIATVNPIWKAGFLAGDGASTNLWRQKVEGFNELLGGSYYLLWSMFMLTTMLFASTLKRDRSVEGAFFWSALAISGLTAFMIIGAIAKLSWAGDVLTWTYAPLLTLYRTLGGIWLLQTAARLSRERIANPQG